MFYMYAVSKESKCDVGFPEAGGAGGTSSCKLPCMGTETDRGGGGGYLCKCSECS